MQDMDKWFGRRRVVHFLHDASIDSFVNDAFFPCYCIMTWGKCGDSQSIHYRHILHRTTKPYFSLNGEITNEHMLEHNPLSTIQIIASIKFSSHSLKYKKGCWDISFVSNQLWTLCLNKFGSLRIKLWYNGLPLITFNNVSHTPSYKPNPCTNFNHNRGMHSQFRHSYSLWHILHEIVIFLVS